MLEHPCNRNFMLSSAQQTVEVSDATMYNGENAISADNQQERPK